MYQNLYFRKSSYSATRNECVEVADAPASHAVRDSTRPEAGHLDFSPTAWKMFIEAIKTDRL